MTTKLSDRLRELRDEHAPSEGRIVLREALDHCIEIAEAQEKLAYFEARVKLSSDDPEAQAGELSEEQWSRIVNHFDRPNWSRTAALVEMAKYLREGRYLRPSQAIGEQTPVAEEPYGVKELQLLPGKFWVTLRGEPVIRGRADQACDSFPEGQALRIRTALNKAHRRSPMSPEARDKAIEAGNALVAYLHEASDMAVIGPKPSDEWHKGKHRVIDSWDQALSALRGE